HCGLLRPADRETPAGSPSRSARGRRARTPEARLAGIPFWDRPVMPGPFRGSRMPKYIILGNWTDQGVKTVKETTKRAVQVKALAAKMGAKLDVYWTMGIYDFVAVAEAPSDEADIELAFT